MALIKSCLKDGGAVTAEPVILSTSSGGVVNNAIVGNYYAIYATANAPITVTGATIISDTPTGETSGVLIIRADNTSFTIICNDFIARACMLVGLIEPAT